MHNEFTAVVERDGEWYIAYSPEVPGSNGQGRTKAECLQNLSEAIELIHGSARRRDPGPARGGGPGDHHDPMKREAPLRHLRRNGCFLKREGHRHSLWCNPLTGHLEAIPRHTEVPDRLAQKICRALEIPEI